MSLQLKRKLPGSKRTFLSLTWPVGVCIAAAAIGVPAFTALDFYSDKKWYWWTMALVAGILVLGGVLQVAQEFFVDQDSDALRDKELSDKKWYWWTMALVAGILVLGGVLQVAQEFFVDQDSDALRDKELEAVLLGVTAGAKALHSHISGKRSAGLRAVLWLRNEDGQTLRQVTTYTGNHRAAGSGRMGRTQSVNCGSVGFAARTGEPHGGFRQPNSDIKAWRDRMVKEYGYRPQEAEKLRVDTFAWLALPIVLGDDVPLFIVYFDSEDPEFFAGTGMLPAVAELCAALTEWAKSYYLESPSRF